MDFNEFDNNKSDKSEVMDSHEFEVNESFLFALANDGITSSYLDLSLIFKQNPHINALFISEILAAINQNHYIQDLKLSSVNNEQLFEFLNNNQNLVKLELINVSLNHLSVQAINAHTNLSNLVLLECCLNETAQAELNQNETLKHFACNNIDFSQINSLFSCNSVLNSLSMSNCKLKDQHLNSLSQQQSLSLLKLPQNQFTWRGMTGLAKLPIVELDLSLQIIDEPCLEVIVSIESLRILVLNNNKLDDQLIALLAKAKHLEVLKLNNNHIGSKGISAFATLTKLRCLEISQSKLENNNLVNLANHKSLQELDISKSYLIDDECIDILFKFYGLVKLNIGSNKLSDIGAARLTQHPSITHLDMSNSCLSIDCLKNMGHDSKILELILHNNKSISDRKIEYVANYPNLHCLDLSYCDIGNKWAKCLAQLGNIKHLNLAKNPKLNNEGAKFLAKSKSLTYLNLDRNTNIRSQSFSELANNKRIKNLALDPKHLNSKGGRALLRNLNIDNLVGPRGDLAIVRLLAVEHQNIINSGMISSCLNKHDGPRLVTNIINQYLSYEGSRKKLKPQ